MNSEVFFIEKHKTYIKNVDLQKDSFYYWATEHLKLSGVYWGLCALDIMNSLEEMNKEQLVTFVLSCQRENGGFGGNVEHDAHILYTLSAVQILVMLDCLEKLNKENVVNFIKDLQREDGSFCGDEWGEVDTRFSYCAICCLSLLGRLDAINVDKAVEFIMRCKNFDGGFGCIPGAESHAGQIFTCVAALSIVGQIHQVDADLLGWWLAERQLPAGGLNGRPEKLPDVCYSWWVLSSLVILDRAHWINGMKLKEFILASQDDEGGGISDRPGDMVDIFHTFFGIGGLSMLGFFDLSPIDPSYALRKSTLKRMGLLKDQK